ncbi:hypothetical protein TNCV_1843981 [Trichonephila clavipes]|nr:hypothetical protein TNCV_1843981 [Trichonephila clavipes]
MSSVPKRTFGSTTRGLLATDHVILNHDQVTWTTPELAPPPNYHTTPIGGHFSLDIFNAHWPSTRRVFSDIRLELCDTPATSPYFDVRMTQEEERNGILTKGKLHIGSLIRKLHLYVICLGEFMLCLVKEERMVPTHVGFRMRQKNKKGVSELLKKQILSE